jgi:UDP-2,4-diacetamido-2,4,6-trideoxy-beta-L-altropyranose hydrolase
MTAGQGTMDAFTIRPATMDDARRLLAWVNDQAVLEIKADTDGPVDWNVHSAWLSMRLADPETYLAIIEVSGVPVGQVRLQPGPGGRHIDVFVAPGHRGRGIARAAVAHALSAIDSRPVIAVVLDGNKGSHALFQSLGAVGVWEDGRTIYEFRDAP